VGIAQLGKSRLAIGVIPSHRGAKDKSQLQSGREKRGTRQDRRRKKRRRERAYYRSSRQVVQKTSRAHRQRTRLVAYRDAMGGSCGRNMQGDHEAQIFYALAGRGFRRSCGQNLRRATSRPERFWRNCSRKKPTHPGFGALHHPYVRRASAGRGKGLVAGAALLGNCARCTTCFAHAIAYVHAHGATGKSPSTAT